MSESYHDDELNSNPEKNNPEKLYLPKFCIVPLAARLDKDLTPAAQIYLGELNVLTNLNGYCWASDEKLAEMKSVSVRTIKNWHTELADKGFIKRDTWRVHVKVPGKKGLQIKTHRKIYVCEEPSKKDAEGQKSAPRSEGQKSAPRSEGQKSAPITKEPLKGKKEDYKPATPESTPSAVVVPSCLNDLEVNQTLRLKITKDYSLEEIEVAVKRCLRWKSRGSDHVGVMTALSQAATWYDEPTKEEKIELNREFLRSLDYLDEKIFGITKVFVCSKHIEFINGPSHVKVFHIRDSDFEKEVGKMLEYIKGKR